MNSMMKNESFDVPFLLEVLYSRAKYYSQFSPKKEKAFQEAIRIVEFIESNPGIDPFENDNLKKFVREREEERKRMIGQGGGGGCGGEQDADD